MIRTTARLLPPWRPGPSMPATLRPPGCDPARMPRPHLRVVPAGGEAAWWDGDKHRASLARRGVIVGLRVKRLVHFDEAEHPRDEDGRFASTPTATGSLASRIMDVFGFDEDQLTEGLTKAHDGAYYEGFTNSGSYSAFADPNHPYITSGEYTLNELSDDETGDVDLPGITAWALKSDPNEGGDMPWVGDFQSSRDIRRAANALAGVGPSAADPHLNTQAVGYEGRRAGATDPRDAVIALAMMSTLKDARPSTRPLYRGTFIRDGNIIEVLAGLAGDFDMPLISVADSEALASSFSTGQVQDGATGVFVHFTFPPGTRAIEGLNLDPDAITRSGMTVDLPDEPTYEWVTGGRFHVDSAVADGDTINVSLTQIGVHDPYGEAAQ